MIPTPPKLTAEQIQANKDLGLNPMFWETAIEIPEHPTPEFLDAHFPNLRPVVQRIAKHLHVQIYAEKDVAS